MAENFLTYRPHAIWNFRILFNSWRENEWKRSKICLEPANHEVLKISKFKRKGKKEETRKEIES